MDQSQQTTVNNTNPNSNADDGRQIFSDNPFDDNYRYKLDMDNPLHRRITEEPDFTPEMIEYYQSAEYAELHRPFDQFRWLLKERGLLDRYGAFFAQYHATPEERYESVSRFVKEEAPDLMERLDKLWEIMKSRAEAVERGETIIPDLSAK